MFFRKSLLCLLAATFTLAAPALSQGIQIDSLNPADSFDAGVLDQSQGGLGANLWQGTNAAQAKYVIEHTNSPLLGTSLSLARTALLSGGVPPQSDSQMDQSIHMAARLGAILNMEDFSSFDQITNRAALNSNSPIFTKLFVKRALLGGQNENACQIADSVTTDRKAPYWIKLRAFCHYTRGELPAAELAMDLLRRKDHKDAAFYVLLGNLTVPKKTKYKSNIVRNPLGAAMAREIYKTKQIDFKILPAAILKDIALDTKEEDKTRLWALKKSAHLMSTQQLTDTLSGLSETPLAQIGDIKKGVWSAQDWGQVYKAISLSADMQNRALLVSALLGKAQQINQFTAFTALLKQDISIIPQNIQAQTSPDIFAKIFVENNDLGGLGSLYHALPEDSDLRPRIALASDALGGGFMLNELGLDIERRLALKGRKQKRAVRDTYIAIALGANLSGKAETLLSSNKLKGHTFKPDSLIALQAAARRGGQAETVLRLASLLDNKPLSSVRADSLATVLMALREARLNDLAAKLAAQDFLDLE